MSTNPRSKTVTLHLMKSTGNTHVYHEEGHNHATQTFPTIYVQKHNFGASDAKPPARIEVTMSWEQS